MVHTVLPRRSSGPCDAGGIARGHQEVLPLREVRPGECHCLLARVIDQ